MSSETPAANRFRPNTIGIVGVAALCVAMMSPALGIYGSWGPMAAIVGRPTPLVYLGALGILLPTAISYAVVSREMPSAGSAFTWVWESATPTAGTFVGLVMATFYVIGAVFQPIVFGLFFNDLLAFCGYHHTTLWTWAAGVLIVTLLTIPLTYGGVRLSARSVTVFIAVEVTVLVALSATIVATRISNGGFTFAPFDPGETIGGVSTFWSAMILGILSFTGFDVVSTVAEETRSPRRRLPIVMVVAVVGVGVFWALNAWAFSIAEPVSKIQELNAAGLTAATPIADHYWGWGRVFVILTALTAVTAVYVATIVGASRALYAMSRQGVLPGSLSALQPRFRVPWMATHVVYGLALAGGFTVVLVLGDALEGFVWWVGAVVLFGLVTYIGVNLANIVYFTRFARERFNWFLNGFVPVAGIALDGYVIYRSFYKTLWSAGFRTGRSVILVTSILLALTFVYVVFVARTRPAAIRSRAVIADEAPMAS